jgi:recombination DNA repair RAD52 pathway protein
LALCAVDKSIPPLASYVCLRNVEFGFDGWSTAVSDVA